MELKTCFPVRVDQEVAWGEQDKLGHVNNTVYFRYFENARIAQFGKLGLDTTTSGFGPILANAQCDFLKPIHFPDRIRTEIGVSRVGLSSFVQQYRIFSYTQQCYVATGNSVSVYYDYATAKSAPIPEKLRQAIAQLEEP